MSIFFASSHFCPDCRKGRTKHSRKCMSCGSFAEALKGGTGMPWGAILGVIAATLIIALIKAILR